MAYTLPWSVNKLVSTNINNSDSITGGGYGNVSFKVNGKSQLVGNTVIEGNVGIGTATTSNKLEVSGNIGASGSLSASSSTIIPTTSSITINNYNFATPAQGLNSYSTIASPYSAITGWTISLVSGTAPTVYVGRGFTAIVNLFETAFPEYPLFIQYLSFQGPNIYQMNVTQSLTFATTGDYILTFYIWGEYNRYVPTNNLTISCGNNSISNFTAAEGAWKKVIMKFQIITAGSNTLTISVNNTVAVTSGLSISGVQIVKQSGLVVNDGTNTNNQLITPKGVYTSGFINNQGNIANYGNFINYGPLNLVAPYSAGTLVVGSSLFGTTNLDTGKYSVLIGAQVVGSASFVAVNCDGCVFIGYGAGEQVQNIIRSLGIGYQSHRWGQTNCNDNVGYGYQSNFALGYSGGTNSNNVSIGNFVLSGAYVAGCNSNTVIGHNSLSGPNFDNSRSFNSICGGSSLQNIVSNYNNSLGYGNANSIVNTSSNYNTFVGAQVCPTQSGSTNVLLNCSFFGSASDVSVAGSYSNSTCLGYNSRITGNNQIILGTANETTFAMGGLTVPVSEVLTILGTMTANSLSITPTQLGYLNALSAGIVSLGGAQQIAGIKTFSDAIASLKITPTNRPELSNNKYVSATNTLNWDDPQNIIFNAAGNFTTFLPSVVSGGILRVGSRFTFGFTINWTGTKTVQAQANQFIYDGGSVLSTISISMTTTGIHYLELLCVNYTAGNICWAVVGKPYSSSIPIATTFSGAVTFTGGITASSTQTITFGTNAPTMAGTNISGVIKSSGNETIAGIKSFSSPPVMDGGSITINTIPLTSVQYTFRNALYNYGYGENALSGIGSLANNNSGFGSAAVGGGGIGTTGDSNSGFGSSSLYQVESGSFNSACGTSSLYGVKTGSYNCALGSTVAYTTDGNNNVFIGYNCATDPFNANITNDNCTLIGRNTYAPDLSSFRTVIGSDATADLGFVGDNSIVLGRDNLDSTYVMKDLYLRGSINILPSSKVVDTTQLDWLSDVNTALDLNITNPKVIIGTSELNNVNTLGTNNTLIIGNSTSITKLNGPLIVSNNSQKVNGYSTLSGTPNNLSKPLSEYYTLASTSTGSLVLPVIDSDMYGSQITFVKVSTAATWTINAGSGNTFRLYKSNSTATATSISMANNFTVLKIVATQSTVWDVIITDIFYEAAANWVVGTRYFPMLMNPTNITAATDWNTTLPSAFYGIQGFSITATVSLTLPLSTNVNVPDGLRIKFRRVGGTLATTLLAIASTGDTIMAVNSSTATAAGSAVTFVNTSTYFGEIYLNKTTKVWYCM